MSGIRSSCSVIVPVYNSSETLPVLVPRLVSALSEFEKLEILLVNDGSRDQSWAAIKALSKAYPQVQGLDLRKNSGQDNAIMAGLRQACGMFVVVMDDDLQHAPEDIPRLVDKIVESDADVCFARFEDKKQAGWKNAGSWLNGKLAEWAIQKPPHVYLSPFKVLRLDVVREMIRYDGPYPYVDGLLFSVTDRIVEVPTTHHSRLSGKSAYTFWKSVKVTSRLVTSFSILPLRFTSFLGVAFSLLGFLIGLFYLIECAIKGKRAEGWLSQVLLCIVLNGVILIALGTVGEYLGRIFLSINKRPQYTVRSSTKESV